jgi:NAD(P)-dependent dehydrogenase (short-subunit alcohol dehydrogenase family)
LTNFSRALARELASERIRGNLLAPDTTPSEGNSKAVPESTIAAMSVVEPARIMETFGTYVPMRLPPMPDDLADVVLFLASDLSRFVTGTPVHVVGGLRGFTRPCLWGCSRLARCWLIVLSKGLARRRP